MIARMWHGMTLASRADEYLDYLNETGVPDLQGTEGNLGVYVLRRFEGDRAHFWIISLWKSLEAIQAFAGPNPEIARYYPRDPEYLLELEPNVVHCEVLVKPPQVWLE